MHLTGEERSSLYLSLLVVHLMVLFDPLTMFTLIPRLFHCYLPGIIASMAMSICSVIMQKYKSVYPFCSTGILMKNMYLVLGPTERSS
ncbi:hypothetical protein EDB19DRAFT_1682591 [Suillus lakei]|nr:hypothetical protein EDB19DRAFT_1682591 [Suillus lakei]